MKGKRNRKKVRELESDIKQTKEKKNYNSHEYLVTGPRFA